MGGEGRVQGGGPVVRVTERFVVATPRRRAAEALTITFQPRERPQPTAFERVVATGSVDGQGPPR